MVVWKLSIRYESNLGLRAALKMAQEHIDDAIAGLGEMSREEVKTLEQHGLMHTRRADPVYGLSLVALMEDGREIAREKLKDFSLTVPPGIKVRRRWWKK
jgi:hypothetical protein